MDSFSYVNDIAHCEGVPLAKIAQNVSTPCYVYSKTELEKRCGDLKSAFAHYPTSPSFAVKANSNLSILKTIFKSGFGADVVSQGELERSLTAGVEPKRVVFSGVGKTESEIERALNLGILALNVESVGELRTIAAISRRLGKLGRVSIRINPNIDVETNPLIATGLYSTKFGIAEDELPAVLEIFKTEASLKLVGIACHIGSQITEISPFQEMAERMALVSLELKQKGFTLELVDMGGGLGIQYQEESPPSFEAYAQAITKPLDGSGLTLVIEPGRCLVGNAGVLLTRIIGIKRTPQKNFVIVDGAMNDLIRPCLYDAIHEIKPVRAASIPQSFQADVVGPICETGDFLGLERQFPPLDTGDLLMIKSCGAYAASMASNYNTRPRAAEVLVSGNNFSVIRPRETLEQLWASEL